MKILHVITGLDVGGAETMLYRLVTTMDTERFETRVVSLTKSSIIGKRLQEAGIPVDSLDMQRGVPSPVGLLRLVKLIRDWRPKLIQTWLYHADLAGLIAAKMAFPMGNGPKVVWNIRCSFMALKEYRQMTNLTLTICRALSSLPDSVLTNSYEAQRFHQEIGYNTKRFHVIPNGIDLDRFRPDQGLRKAVRQELSIPQEAVVFGHIARMDAMKDHETMVRAAAQVARKADAVFVFAGQGVDSGNWEMANWMRKYGLRSERTRLLGLCENVERIMAALDVHVLSSIGESFPNVVGEAMACGVPNIVTDVGDSAYLVGDTGEVVLPSDSSALAKAMLHMVALGESGRRSQGTSARKRMETKYNLSVIVKRYESLYKELVGKE